MDDLPLGPYLTRDNVLDLPVIDADSLEGSISRPEILGPNSLNIRLLDEHREALGSVSANALKNIRVTLQTRPALQTLPLLLVELYRDNDLTEADAWPEPNTRLEIALNQHRSNYRNGTYVWNVRVKNEDGANAHTFFFYCSALLPLGMDGSWTVTTS